MTARTPDLDDDHFHPTWAWLFDNWLGWSPEQRRDANDRMLAHIVDLFAPEQPMRENPPLPTEDDADRLIALLDEPLFWKLDQSIWLLERLRPCVEAWTPATQRRVADHLAELLPKFADKPAADEAHSIATDIGGEEMILRLLDTMPPTHIPEAPSWRDLVTNWHDWTAAELREGANALERALFGFLGAEPVLPDLDEIDLILELLADDAFWRTEESLWFVQAIRLLPDHFDDDRCHPIATALWDAIDGSPPGIPRAHALEAALRLSPEAETLCKFRTWTADRSPPPLGWDGHLPYCLHDFAKDEMRSLESRAEAMTLLQQLANHPSPALSDPVGSLIDDLREQCPELLPK